MAGPSTRRALGRRAVGAASILKDWLKYLDEQMKKQNVGIHAKRSGRLQTDDQEHFTLTKRDIRKLTDDLHQIISEIDRFSDGAK